MKEVVKALRKKEKGFVLENCMLTALSAHGSRVNSLIVMAADISPMDILTHIPVLSEDAGNPYVFVPSKELLGQASSTKRPTSCIMISDQPVKLGKKAENKINEDRAKDPAAELVRLTDLKEYRSCRTIHFRTKC